MSEGAEIALDHAEVARIVRESRRLRSECAFRLLRALRLRLTPGPLLAPAPGPELRPA